MAALGGASALDSRVQSERGNEVLAEGVHGNHNVVFCRHDRPVETNAMDDADYLILEMSDIDYRTLKIGDADFKTVVERLLAYEPYAHLVRAAAERKRPIYFVDNSLSLSSQTGLAGSYATLAAVGGSEAFVGTMALDFALRPEQQTETKAARALAGILIPKGPEDVSARAAARRGFLRIGLGTLGAYLLTPAIRAGAFLSRAVWNGHPDKNAPSTCIGHALTRFDTCMHPELATAVFEGRNALIAQKAESIAVRLTEKIGRKPRSCIVIGGAHAGILQELRSPETERLHRLASIIGDERMDGEKYMVRVDASSNPDDAFKLDCILTVQKDPGIEFYKK